VSYPLFLLYTLGFEGVSIRLSCAQVGIQPSQYRRWKKSEEKFVLCRKKSKKSLTPGPKSCLSHIEKDLIDWFKQQCLRGMGVSNRMLVMKACKSDPGFKEKLAYA